MEERRENRTKRRSFVRLAAVGLTVAGLLGACGTAASPSPSAPAGSRGRSASAAPSAAEQARHHHGRRAAPRRHPGSRRCAEPPDQPVPGQVPLDHGQPGGIQLDRADLHGGLAAGTLPDVFTIPFTDGKGLIAQHQIVNLDSRLRALPYVDKFNPNVLVERPGRRRQDLGRARRRPTACRSPTTGRSSPGGTRSRQAADDMGEVRAAAKTIAEKTGKAGFAEMATENTGGWQLTTATYARGGRVQTVADDGKVTSTVNNPATKGALAVPQGPPLGRQLDGRDVRLRLGHHQPGLRCRPDRHVHRRLRPVHRDGPEQRPEGRRLRRHDDPARRATRMRASSAAGPSPRSTSTPPRKSATQPSTSSTSTT